MERIRNGRWNVQVPKENYSFFLQYLGNAFEYVGPIPCRRIPDNDERG